MEPLEYLGIFRRRWRIVFAALLIGVVIGVVSAPGAAQEGPKRYAASHVLLFNGLTAINLPQTALLATAGDVPDRAAARIGVDEEGGDIADQITSVADAETGTITITSVQEDPERAALLADTVAEELVATLAGQGEQAQQSRAGDVLQRLDELRVTIDALDVQLAGTPVTGQDVIRAERDALVNQYRLTYEELQQIASTDAPVGPLSTLQAAEARPVNDASSFKPPRSRVGRGVLAGIVGLFLGVCLALLAERVDTRLRTKEGAEQVLGLPVLGEIPAAKQTSRTKVEIDAVERPGSPVAEAYRILRTTLLFLQRWGPDDAAGGTAERKQVLLVTSPGASEGKTTTVANLAAVFAESGLSVVVLDCDLRRPRLHEVFRVGEGTGLQEALTARSRAAWLAEAVRDTNVEGVRIVAGGRPIESPAAYLNIAREMIVSARELADIVLVDTAPLLAANDAIELASVVDGILVITRSSRTTAGSAQRATELLERLGAPVIGAVLVGAPEVQTSYSTAYYARPAAGRTGRRSPQPADVTGERDSGEVGVPAAAQEDGPPLTQSPSADAVPAAPSNGAAPQRADKAAGTATLAGALWRRSQRRRR